MDEHETLKTCFDRHAATLVLFARQWVGSRADAEDVVQEAFISFWGRRGKAADPVAYLYQCVRSKALDLRRTIQRRAGREARAAQEAQEPAETFFERTLEARETLEAVQAALHALPREQAEVIVMKVWGGLTFPQIGQAVQISPNTAASRYRYGIESLRAALAHEVEP